MRLHGRRRPRRARWHLSAWSTLQREPLATRACSSRGEVREASIGRVVTTAAARGRGLGRETMIVASRMPPRPGRPSRSAFAQSRLEGSTIARLRRRRPALPRGRHRPHRDAPRRAWRGSFAAPEGRLSAEKYNRPLTRKRPHAVSSTFRRHRRRWRPRRHRGRACRGADGRGDAAADALDRDARPMSAHRRSAASARPPRQGDRRARRAMAAAADEAVSTSDPNGSKGPAVRATRAQRTGPYKGRIRAARNRQISPVSGGVR